MAFWGSDYGLTELQSSGAAGTFSDVPDFASIFPDDEPRGPDGRTYDQIKGTPYKSDAERTWFLAQDAQRAGTDRVLGNDARSYLQSRFADTNQGYDAPAPRTVQSLTGQPFVDRAANQQFVNFVDQNFVNGVPLPGPAGPTGPSVAEQFAALPEIVRRGNEVVDTPSGPRILPREADSPLGRLAQRLREGGQELASAATFGLLPGPERPFTNIGFIGLPVGGDPVTGGFGGPSIATDLGIRPGGIRGFLLDNLTNPYNLLAWPGVTTTVRPTLSVGDDFANVIRRGGANPPPAEPVTATARAAQPAATVASVSATVPPALTEGAPFIIGSDGIPQPTDAASIRSALQSVFSYRSGVAVNPKDPNLIQSLTDQILDAKTIGGRPRFNGVTPEQIQEQLLGLLDEGKINYGRTPQRGTVLRWVGEAEPAVPVQTGAAIEPTPASPPASPAATVVNGAAPPAPPRAPASADDFPPDFGARQPSLPGTPPPPAPAQQPIPFNLWNEIKGVLGLAQTTASTLDASAIYRQGGYGGWANPREWRNAISQGLKSFTSENAYKAADDAIKADPWYSISNGARKGLGFVDDTRGVKGHIYETGPRVAANERVPGFTGLNESNISRFAGNLPGIKNSERAYATVLNVQGQQVYGKYMDALWNTGVRGEELERQAAGLKQVINHMRGYGDFNVGQIGAGVNAFFSGRNLVATFQRLLDPVLQPGSLLQPSARQLAAKNLAGFIAGNGALVGLMAVTGEASGKWSVNLDPRSTDWGKVKIGNMRIDPWGGYGPWVRTIARGYTGERLTGTGEVKPTTFSKEVLRTLSNKKSPIAALATERYTGKDALGVNVGKLTPQRIGEMFVPFIVQDVYDAYQQQEGSMLGRAATAALTGATSFVGFGTNTYGPTASERLDLALRNLPVAERTNLEGNPVEFWDQLSSATKNDLQRAHPEIKALADEAKQQGLNRESPLSVIAEDRTQALASAYTDFQKTGDGAAYRDQTGNISNEARIRFEQETKSKQPEALTPEQRLLDSYFKTVVDASGQDYELRDRLETEFRAKLSPAASAALDANLQTSPDIHYQQLKAARSYLDDHYWNQKDEAFARLVATAAPGSPATQYSSYTALSQAAADRTKNDVAAQKLKSAVDSRIDPQLAKVRIDDPKADALLYIYGYRDSVTSAQAQAMVVAWAQEQGVKLASPRITVPK